MFDAVPPGQQATRNQAHRQPPLPDPLARAIANPASGMTVNCSATPADKKPKTPPPRARHGSQAAIILGRSVSGPLPAMISPSATDSSGCPARRMVPVCHPREPGGEKTPNAQATPSTVSSAKLLVMVRRHVRAPLLCPRDPVPFDQRHVRALSNYPCAPLALRRQKTADISMSHIA